MPLQNNQYFRPSCHPALNGRFENFDVFVPYYDKKYNQILLPADWTGTPENTLLNYFSLLREAYFMEERSCGSIGQAQYPFPLAYNFFSKDYQKRVKYEAFIRLFTGIGHTSLIKLCRVPDEKGTIKFFYEIETIEVLEHKKAEYFGYTYGFIQLVHEEDGYRISAIQEDTEDFLCAPYHGWSHDGESVIDVKYGSWCSFIQKKYPMIQKEYVKYISFHGKDGADYCFIFFTLTNGTDIEIAQFRRIGNDKWRQVNLNPEKDCIE
ncbi:MAG: hypothetical protein ABF649_05220 [Bacillus sp. (in: firmicutes)]